MEHSNENKLFNGWLLMTEELTTPNIHEQICFVVIISVEQLLLLAKLQFPSVHNYVFTFTVVVFIKEKQGRNLVTLHIPNLL